VAQGAPGLFMLDDGQPDSSARVAKPGDKDSAAAAAVGSMSRLQARVLKAGAVTASIGIGTAATFGVAAWQGIDSWRAQRADQEKSENSAFKDLTERWARLHGGGGGGDAPALLAAELLRTGDLLCREGSDNFMAKFRLSVRMVDDAKQACAGEAAGQRAPACARLLDPGNGIDCLQPAQAPPCAPRYWARDYSGQTGSKQNCSGTLPQPFKFAVWLRDRFTGFGGGDLVASAPPPASTPAPDGTRTPPPIAPDACEGTVVYILTYGTGLRDKARAWRGRWRELGASVPPIEDVLSTSRRAGRAPPVGHPVPTIVIRAESARACAEALTETAESPTGQPWTIRLLPRPGLTDPSAIEVWLPRVRDGVANTS